MKVCPVCGTEYGEEAAFCSRDRSPLRPAGTAESEGLVGQLVGERYQVERRLGEGGMGEVYLARHVLMGRPCALKVMSQSLSKDPDAVSRFNREATSASSISHPNVCAVYDFGLTSEGLIYLAMEYVEGRTLSAVLEEAGTMPVRRAAALIAQCAAGLQAAHGLGIVHRDLKPDNIMVLASRQPETAKLVDFGIAKAVEGTPGQRVTKTGFVIGTPEYMSPEQLSGDPVNGRSDQYSLALVFYRLITGRLPFEGNSIQETLVKRLTDPPRPLALSRPELTFPAGLQAIMDRALARDSEERYSSVTEFADAIDAVVAGDDVPTRRLAAVPGGGRASIPPTRVSPEARPGRGRRGVLAVTALAVVAVGAWGVSQVAKAPAAGGRPADSSVTSIPPSAAPTAAPAPVPPPAATPAGVTEKPRQTAVAKPESAQPDSMIVPDPEDLDSAPPRRAWAVRQAKRVLESRLPPERRAVAAEVLAQDALKRGDRPGALEYYRRAYGLNPLVRYLTMVNQLQDSTPL